MQIEKRKVGELKEANYNPRQISNFMMEKLKKSIKEFGYVEPVILNKRSNSVVGGHQRIKALIELYGPDHEIEVIIVDLDDTKEKALNLALNRIDGEWVEDKLIDVLRQIEEKEELDLELTGFSDSEIDLLLSRLVKYEEPIQKEPTIDDIKETFVKTGDIYELDGKHRIMCGDATDPNNYKKLFEMNKMDLLVTSPPYNADIKYSEYSDNKEFAEYMKLIENVYKCSKEYLNKDRFVCINIGDMTKCNLTAHHSIILEKLGFKYARTIYWIKPEGAARGVVKIPYPRWVKQKVATESIIVYYDPEVEREPEFFSVLITYTDREIVKDNKPNKTENKPVNTDLFKRYNTNVWRMSPETQLSKSHPAPYPTQLSDNCVTFYSLENEIVYDCFLGSGTTIISANKNGRKGYGMDIDPKYVELSLKRYKVANPNAQIKCLNRDIKV